uniref:Ig-like domain-containing protein n=1 Tax=Anas zonorhyncha TaxID=75864 RepID=A0A8B9UM99_9AVES
MQPCCLLLFPFFFFFPGTWAELEGSHMLQLLHFVTFQNATSMQVGGLGLVGDIKIGSLDRRTGDIHYHQPWLRPALPKGDWDVIESSIKSYVRDFNSLVQKLTNHIRMSYPFVFQSSISCKLEPNRTTRTFLAIAYEGEDLLQFHLKKGTWDRVPDNEMSATAEHLLNNATTLNELIQVLLNVTCVDILERFIEYGRVSLERHVRIIPVETGNARVPVRLSCYIWGFYPPEVTVIWLHNGDIVEPDDYNPISAIPNGDWTYQTQVSLLVAPVAGDTYTCSVQHVSLQEPLLEDWSEWRGAGPHPEAGGLGSLLPLTWPCPHRSRTDAGGDDTAVGTAADEGRETVREPPREGYEDGEGSAGQGV